MIRLPKPPQAADPEIVLSERLLTTQEVADDLQVSRRSIERRIKCGDLACTRIGRSVRIRPRAVRDMLDRS